MTVEFVDREKAEADAERAIGLMNASDEARVEAWRAMWAVADQVGEVSNLGIRGLYYVEKAGRMVYLMNAKCVDGHVNTDTGAPATLEEARAPERLQRAIAVFNAKVAEKGGRCANLHRPKGTAQALIEAVSSSSAGEAWLAGKKRPDVILTNMVKVIDAYGEDVFPAASLHAHVAFLAFANRKDLVREFPATGQAAAKALSMRLGSGVVPAVASSAVPTSAVTRLAINAGVSQSAARAILREFMDGTSKTRLRRAVDMASEMVDSPASRLAAA